MPRNPALRTAHLKEKHRRVRLSRFAIFLGASVLILIGLFFLFRASFMLLDGVRVSGAVAVSENDIEAVANGALSGTYAYLVPRKAILFYPRRMIEGTILSLYPRIESADVFRDGKTLVIRVVERRPDALWCGERQNEKAACFYVDEKGLVFGESPDFSGPVFMEFSVDGSGTSVVPFHLLSESDYRAVRDFADRVGSALVRPVSAYVNAERDIFVRLSYGLEVWATFSRDLGKQFAVLETLLTDAKLKQSFLAADRKVQYVDVRFGNKVFYK